MKSVVLTIILFFSQVALADMVAYSTMNQIKGSFFERYILVKGQSLKSPIQKLKDHGKLATPRPSIFYDFEIAKVNSWTVIKLPKTTSHWMHHNITYWYLGWGAEDPNYADSVIGLAVGANGQSYSIYGTNDKSRPQDSLYGRTSAGTSFLINIPFDQLLVDHKNLFPNSPDIARSFNLPANISFSKARIEYHETLDQTIH